MNYRILSEINDDNVIYIRFTINGTDVASRFLTLDVNGDNMPTFANSRLPYVQGYLLDFVENIKNNRDDIFTFDNNEESFDSIYYVSEPEQLRFIVRNEKMSLTYIINLVNKDEIVGDLLVLESVIQRLINEKLEYLNSLNPEEEVES